MTHSFIVLKQRRHYIYVAWQIQLILQRLSAAPENSLQLRNEWIREAPGLLQMA